MTIHTQKHRAFKQRVFDIVKKIPEGGTLTYAEVARAIGNKNNARAVGNALKTNYDPSIPCHRVIRSDGTLGKYNRGAKMKQKLLFAEMRPVYKRLKEAAPQRFSTIQYDKYKYLTLKKRKRYTIQARSIKH